MTVVENAAGVCVIRDARDLVPFVCGHYLRVGLGHVRFVDDGSSDGTFEFLSELSRRTPRVSVRRVDDDTYRQAELMTGNANELIDRGYRMIVPFDADELWHFRGGDVARLSAGTEEGAFFGRWVNFVQQRRLESPRRLGLFGMRLRAPALGDATHATVANYERPFVCSSDRKAAFRARHRIEIEHGQHPPTVPGPTVTAREFEVFHLPLRYRSEIVKRGLDYEPRRAPLRTAAAESWQSAFHRTVVLNDRVDEVWRANSASAGGTIDAYGTTIDLIPDARLRAVLLRASLYLAARTRMLAL